MLLNIILIVIFFINKDYSVFYVIYLVRDFVFNIF